MENLLKFEEEPPFAGIVKLVCKTCGDVVWNNTKTDPFRTYVYMVSTKNGCDHNFETEGKDG